MAQAIAGEGISIIAEIKRASPSRGKLREQLDPRSLARAYEEGGAAAISVLTEEEFFSGGFADLEAVRTAVSLPLLCKDFIIDPWQIYRARVAGADAVLLIAAILSDEMLAELAHVAQRLDMDILLEVHDEEELERAKRADANIIGINNRNLRDFSVDLATFEALAPLVEAARPLVAESGVRSTADVRRMEQAGASAVLVGEGLVRSHDPAEAIRQLKLGDGGHPCT